MILCFVASLILWITECVPRTSGKLEADNLDFVWLRLYHIIVFKKPMFLRRICYKLESTDLRPLNVHTLQLFRFFSELPPVSGCVFWKRCFFWSGWSNLYMSMVFPFSLPTFFINFRSQTQGTTMAVNQRMIVLFSIFTDVLFWIFNYTFVIRTVLRIRSIF